ncbi:TRAP transporter small permease [Pueribacillus sp. YX66]|uniref:TRAP transporter small permease n=1 Tax=Pueribacillus sp. YX66 TaxID=3229242 RepID=UPI00358D2F6C
MKIFLKTIEFITEVNKKIAYVSLAFMMLAVSIFSIARTMGHSLIGNIEIVQFLMILLIASALAFTEREDAHISIGVIVDFLPSPVQRVVDLIAYSLLFVFCMLIAWIVVIQIDFLQVSTLMEVPYFPFKIMIVIGYFAWGLEALRKLMMTIRNAKTLNE